MATMMLCAYTRDVCNHGNQMSITSETTDTPTVHLGEAHIVSQAPVSIRNWGPWQFPQIERLADGRIHIWFHVEADSALAYGKDTRHAISADECETWTETEGYPIGSGIGVESGDRIRIHAERSVPADGLGLGSPEGTLVNYSQPVQYFDARNISKEYDGWFLDRSTTRGDFLTEKVKMSIPGEVRHVVEGVLTRPFFHRICPGPAASLWAPHYFSRLVDGELQKHWSAVFLTSSDEGKSWRFASEIPYDLDSMKALSGDPLAEKRIGFSEPDILFLDDSRCLTLLRTTDGNGVGPSYLAVSTDGGVTWGDPLLFDTIGVWPSLALLGNGSVLASYGRPGLFVRALSADAIARNQFETKYWSAPVPVVPSGPLQTDSCSYSNLLVVDEETAYIAYSDFTIQDDNGRPRKTILVRTVAVE